MTMNTASPNQSSVLEQSSKFTPGPWTFRWAGHQSYIIDGANCSALAVAVDEDDARLIAAAPEMLAALEMMLDVGVLNPTGSRLVEQAVQRMKDARAKATGAA